MSVVETKRPDFPWLRKLAVEQSGYDRIGALNIVTECEAYIVLLETRLSTVTAALETAKDYISDAKLSEERAARLHDQTTADLATVTEALADALPVVRLAEAVV